MPAAVGAYGGFRIQLLYFPVDFLQQILRGKLPEFLVFPIYRIFLILLRGQLHAAAVERKTLPAALTLADAYVPAAVVPRLVTEHIEKYPVHRIIADHLFQNLQGALLLIGPVDTGRRRIIVKHRLTLYGLAEPFRMGCKKLDMRFAEIKPGYHPDAVFMAPAQKVSKEIVFQIGAGFLTFQPCGMKCGNASSSHHADIGPKLLQRFHIRFHIHPRINIPEIVLYHPESFFCPPAHLLLSPSLFPVL